ncbi:uncharacterized protein [Lepeophtheirus salmonis]|uniref:uncharacterized protein n=1 Tax=Lepeophtheirus salmonis TaxID=72036 RepID=UPI001AE992C8|nr:uncharacterized protein LOC121114134 [Lepeophtheirus salmonis]
MVSYFIGFFELWNEKNLLHDEQGDRRKSLWCLLEVVTDLEEHLSKMGGISAEMLINIVIPTEDKEVNEKMWILLSTCIESEYLFLNLSKNTHVFTKVISLLIDQFASKIPCKKSLEALLLRLPENDNSNKGDIDGMIISLSQGLDLSNHLRKFLTQNFYPQKFLEDWTEFLNLLFEVQDKKPPITICEKMSILKDPRLQLGIFLPRLFRSLNDKMSTVDACRTFVFFSYILGFSPLNLIQKNSLWLVSSKQLMEGKRASNKAKFTFLIGMVEGLQEKEDKGWKVEIFGDTTFLKWVQYLVKDLILQLDNYVEVISKLLKMNPVIIEPLVGTYSCSLLFNELKDFSAEFSLLVDIYSKLRLIPKLMAKILIYLAQHPEVGADFDKKAISSATWNKLGTEFQGLVFGQCLELWKTFNYHLDDNKPNSIAFLDIVMDLFLSNCRLVDFSVPENVFPKVFELIKKTSLYIDKLPRSKGSLIDLSLLLKNVRGVEYLSILSDPPNNVLQKIKWYESHQQNISLTFQDVKDLPFEHFSFITPHLDGNEMRKLAEHYVVNPHPDQNIDEDQKLQSSIIDFLETQISTVLSLNRNRSTDVIEELNSLLQGNNSFPKCKAESKAIEELLISYLQLPLEYLEERLSEQVLSFCICLLLRTKEVHSSYLFHIISRCMFTMKHLKKFKTLDVGLILVKLAPIPCEGKWKKTAIQYIIKYSLRSLKNLSDLELHIDEFTKMFNLESNELEISALLLSELSKKLLSSSEASNTTYVLSKKLFDSMAKCNFDRISKLNNEEQESIYLLLTGTSGTLKVLHGNKKSLSLWTNHVEKLFYFCIDDSNVTQNTTIDFLTCLCNEYIIFKKAIDVPSIWNKLKKKIQFSLHEKTLLESLFQIPDKDVVHELLSDILSMSMKNENIEEFCGCIGMWQILVQLKKIPSEILSTREEYIKRMLNFYHDLVISDKLSYQAIMKVLELEIALFYNDKPVVHEDVEASCLITPLRVNFKTYTENEHFFDLWNAVYELMYLVLQRRSTLIITRIPIVLDIVRNMVESLMKSSDQSIKELEEPVLEKLSLCTRRLERLLESFGRNRDDFSRVTPYLVADILSGFQNFKIHTEIRSNIVNGLHWLFKLGDKHSLAFLASSLPLGLTEMFKQLHDDYIKNYKFSGKI